MNDENIIYNENLSIENEECSNESISNDKEKTIGNSTEIKILHISPFISNDRIVKYLDKTSKPINKQIEIPKSNKRLLSFETNIINSILKKKKF